MTKLYTYSDFEAWFKNFKKIILHSTSSNFSEENKKELIETFNDVLVGYSDHDTVSNNPLAVINSIVNEGLNLAKEYDDAFVIPPSIEVKIKELAVQEWKNYQEKTEASPIELAEVVRQAKSELPETVAEVLNYTNEVEVPKIKKPEKEIELLPKNLGKR